MSIPNPLAYYLAEAQNIVAQASAPTADKSAAIKSLAELLCTPVAHSALLNAGFVVTPAKQCLAQLAAA